MREYLQDLFALHRGTDDFETVLKSVKDNSYFMGASLWILVFAIIIASVGLNMNSTAVIIGAMLISPLMGPIVSAGFGLAIYDIELLRNSLRNLLIATVISVVASALYFWLSPFKAVQSELLSRTSPTIYDVIIAFFGGLTGAITITRKDKGNPLPGVAIATALMPPLCTAGYGIATWNFSFFFGALYLYLINCTFILIATIIIIKFLNFGKIGQIDTKYKKKIKNILYGVIILVLLPSIYFAYILFDKQKFIENSAKFIEKEFIEHGYTVVYQRTTYESSGANKIELAFLTRNMTQNQIDSMSKRLAIYNIKNTKLEIKSNNTKDLIMMRNDLMNEVSRSQRLIRNNDSKIDSILNAQKTKTYETQHLLQDLQAIVPEILELSFNDMKFTYSDTSSATIPTMIYKSKKKLKKEQLAIIKAWIERTYEKDTVVLIRY